MATLGDVGIRIAAECPGERYANLLGVSMGLGGGYWGEARRSPDAGASSLSTRRPRWVVGPAPGDERTVTAVDRMLNEA